MTIKSKICCVVLLSIVLHRHIKLTVWSQRYISEGVCWVCCQCCFFPHNLMKHCLIQKLSESLIRAQKSNMTQMTFYEGAKLFKPPLKHFNNDGNNSFSFQHTFTVNIHIFQGLHREICQLHHSKMHILPSLAVASARCRLGGRQKCDFSSD